MTTDQPQTQKGKRKPRNQRVLLRETTSEILGWGRHLVYLLRSSRTVYIQGEGMRPRSDADMPENNIEALETVRSFFRAIEFRANAAVQSVDERIQALKSGGGPR